MHLPSTRANRIAKGAPASPREPMDNNFSPPLCPWQRAGPPSRYNVYIQVVKFRQRPYEINTDSLHSTYWGAWIIRK
jgi:hypothetical protein